VKIHVWSFRTACAIAVSVVFASAAFAVDPGKLTVDLSKPGGPIGKLFYGLMTEEINHAYDGGLYAELVQNRTFQDSKNGPVNWSIVKTGASDGTIALDSANPVNDTALKTSLKLTIASVDPGGRVGVANSGFWGIPIWPNTKYHASFYARSGDGFSGPLTIQIESNDGATKFASATVDTISGDWKKYQIDLTTQQVPTSTSNRLVISAGAKGTVWFSLVSLFPPTYNDRPNGNRIDIMQKLTDLHPAFLRFPGGNYLEGDTIPDRFNWKNTIGPLEQRPGHQGPWRYRSSDGFGLLEFLDWCEDLHMEPLLAVYAGYALKHDYVKPGPDLVPFVQDDLDEIEYCTGDSSTKWGKQRAADGHPDPFVIHFIEIGNEDWFDRSGSYEGRFAQIFDAIKAKYPNLQCISTTPVKSRKTDLIDDHAYLSFAAMLKSVHRYDKYDQKLPKVFFGEWATREGSPTPNLRAALGDAAWLTGLQTDASTVLMNSYAPLFVNVNEGAWQWRTDLIGYNATSSFGSASYYAQSMFSNNLGDTILPIDLKSQELAPPASAPVPQGQIGVGTARSTGQFKDIKVTSGDQTLYPSDLTTTKPTDWNPATGTWAVQNGALQQTNATARDARDFAGDTAWKDYTLSLKAQQMGDDAGFQIFFHVVDHDNMLALNVGGGGKADVHRITGRDRDPLGAPADFTTESGKWYDIRIETKGTDIKCYVDDKLIIQTTDTPPVPPGPLFAAASRATADGVVILKVVNVSSAPQQIEINLTGATDIAKEADVQTLTGLPGDVNSIDSPQKVAPEKATITDASAKFVHEFPQYSVTVMRLKAK
jgi:alpha-N-arabinofuranosidase